MFALVKTGFPNQLSTWFSRKAYNSWIPVTRKCNKMEIQLVILFLSRKEFHAKQIFVLSSSMKLGPDASSFGMNSRNSQLWLSHTSSRLDIPRMQWKRLPSCPPLSHWKASVEAYNFDIGWSHLPRRNTLVPLPFQNQAYTHATVYMRSRFILT